MGKRNKKTARTPLEVAVKVLTGRYGLSLTAVADRLSTTDNAVFHQTLQHRMAQPVPKEAWLQQLADGIGVALDELTDQMFEEWDISVKNGTPLAYPPQYINNAKAVVTLA